MMRHTKPGGGNMKKTNLFKHLIILFYSVFLSMFVLAGCATIPSEVLLNSAASNGDVEQVKLLIVEGTNVDAILFGQTPLHLAVYNGHKSVAELLIVNGANINAQDENGWTPLHSAASNGHKSIVELLIANGANINTQNESGRTPLHLAVYNGHKSIAELLIANGAEEIESEIRALETEEQSGSLIAPSQPTPRPPIHDPVIIQGPVIIEEIEEAIEEVERIRKQREWEERIREQNRLNKILQPGQGPPGSPSRRGPEPTFPQPTYPTPTPRPGGRW
jgi:hypothetical protein